MASEKLKFEDMTASEFLMSRSPRSYGSLADQGRNGDTMLAHINPREANLLQSLGGSGSVNPYTGLREFYGVGDGDGDPGESLDGFDGFSGFDSDAYGDPGDSDVNAEPPGMEDFDVTEPGAVASFFGMGQPTFSPAGTQSPDSGYGVGNALSSLAESAIAALTMGVVNPDFDGKSLIGADRGQPGVSFGFPMVGTFGPNASLDSRGLSFDPGIIANTVSEQGIGSLFGLDSFSVPVPSPVSVPVAEETQYAVRDDGDLFSVGGGGFRRPYETGLL